MKILALLGFGVALPIALALLTWQFLQRKTGYKHVRDASTYLTDRLAGLSSYEKILEHLESLPEEIAIEHDAASLRHRMFTLGDSLVRQPPPYSFWGDKFKSVALTIDDLHRKDNLPLLVDHPTLALVPHFNRRLSADLIAVKSSARQRDEKECNRSVGQMLSDISELATLADTLHELRSVAVQGIRPIDRQQGEPDESRHRGEKVIFQSPITGQLLVWRPWDAFSTSSLLEKLAAWIDREITDAATDAVWKFDAVCAVSMSGLPLATLLAAKLGRRPLMAVDDCVRTSTERSEGAPHTRPDQEFRILPVDWADRGFRRLLLVDSATQTGSRLSDVKDRLEEGLGRRAEEQTVAGVVSVCINDLLPEGEPRLPLVDELLDSNRLMRMFDLSDLCRLYQEDQEQAD